eukprot:5802406-Amphidinium_carterae.1
MLGTCELWATWLCARLGSLDTASNLIKDSHSGSALLYEVLCDVSSLQLDAPWKEVPLQSHVIEKTRADRCICVVISLCRSALEQWHMKSSADL